ncbi:hypothetical protein C7T94_10265 [Pedobacter yulinensis]|uniref:Uncharacterized protein n=1 Tax=Pedobacter yulinensis TaxID=2126353 RepID=A0A2T3HKN0_9SPHI|nr:DUF6526 family protein [Pedobacter yulinensis]PST83002.1 hypothetical protein C7T94_10265 [Pedobacter yulinensis]
MDQNYKNHRQYVPAYHFVLLPLSLGGLVITVFDWWPAVQQHWLYALVFLLFLLTAYCLRSFALKVQDRVIRAEEGLRHYLLTGKPLPAALQLPQILALRFASDEEMPALAQRAVAENLSADQIKRAVKNWRADQLRA